MVHCSWVSLLSDTQLHGQVVEALLCSMPGASLHADTIYICRNTGPNTMPARQKHVAATEHRVKSAEQLRMPKVGFAVAINVSALA